MVFTMTSLVWSNESLSPLGLDKRHPGNRVEYKLLRDRSSHVLY